MPNHAIMEADCLELMRAEFPEASADSIVTDPPYGLNFMNSDWDHGVPGVPFWTEALRVLKPGGQMLAFGGTRTYHRLACAIEDAGFEIRDSIMWLYGSGFPKSHNIGKAIDKAAGAEREVIGAGARPDGSTRDSALGGAPGTTLAGSADGTLNTNGAMSLITTPATDAAKQWDGWGTALKPAYEPIVLARKPFKGTVAKNVIEHGTGALNIDGCRVGTDGRWPANVILDEQAWAMLGEPARFFYCAKASKKERGEGNIHPTVKPIALMRYLCRLITPPSGVVLDPFCGSGTTGVAAVQEGFDFVGIEQTPEYVAIAESRLLQA